jgi:Ca-activated chloride channel homolog
MPQRQRRAGLDRPPLLIGAIGALQMQTGTAIDSAIALGLAELFPDHGIDLAR